jgi:hypothetical protein
MLEVKSTAGSLQLDDMDCVGIWVNRNNYRDADSLPFSVRVVIL